MRTHTHAHTHTLIAAAQPHVLCCTFSFPPLRLTFILPPSPSFFFFFLQSRDPSRMLSHIGSSPGRAFSCCLLACNNYSISRQCVPLIVLLGCRCRGAYSGEGRGDSGGGEEVVTGGAAGGGKRQGWRVGLGGVAHPAPVRWKPRAGLMSFSLAH